MKKKILIVGGTGFLGRKLSERLAGSYEVIVASHCKLGEGIVTYSSVENLLAQIFKYDLFAVINCAVLYDRSNQGGTEVAQVNVELPLKLARYAQKNGISLFISCDSFYRRFDLGVANNHYVQQKKVLYKQLKRLPGNSATKVVVAIIHHMYGAGDSREKIINKLADTLAQRGRITLSACQQNRYFIDVDDVVEHFVEILAENEKLHSFNEIDIAGNHFFSTKEFLCKLSMLIKNGEVFFDDSIRFAIDENVVHKEPLPNWFSFHQQDLETSLKRLL